jgi:uncharacterized membrane protein YgaE (UPF0421/DUF939 family)
MPDPSFHRVVGTMAPWTLSGDRDGLDTVDAGGRWLRDVSPIAQQAAAATLAWLLAANVLGHSDPFFAPVAAVVGLNATLGRRGSNAVRLLAGVVVGVLVSELVLWLVGDGVWTLALATFLAMLVARAVDKAWIVQAQAGVSAVLVTVVGTPEQGWDRLVDAIVGSAVALLFSQLLFVPEPLRLLRRAETSVLSSLADGLRLTANAMERGDRQNAERAVSDLRDLRDRLATLNTTRTASHQIVRHSLTWRRRAGLVVAERERADQLDLLAGSCLMLARTATDVKGEPRRQLTTTVRRLAAVIDDLAEDPGDPATRERAAERAVEFALWLVQHGGRVPAQSALAAACAGVRMVAIGRQPVRVPHHHDQLCYPPR